MKRNIEQSVWAVLEYLSYPLLMFLSTPFFLEHLGEAAYGQWMLLIGLSGLGGMTGLGIGSATTKEVSFYRGLNAKREIFRALVGSSLSLALLGNSIVALLYFLSWCFLPESWTAKIGSDLIIEHLLLTSLVVISTEQLDSVISGCIKGYERFDKCAHAELLIKFFSVFAYVSVVMHSSDIKAVFYTAIFIGLLRLIVKTCILAKVAGENLFVIRWAPEFIKNLFNFGKWTWMQSIGAALLLSIDKIIIGSYLGTEALARYSIFGQLAQQIHTITAAAASIIFPYVSRSKAKGESVLKTINAYIIYVGLFSTIIGLTMFIFGKDIFHLWLTSSFGDEEYLTFNWLVFAYWMLSLNVVLHYVFLGANKAKFVALSNLILGLLSVIFFGLIVKNFGILGGAYAKVFFAVGLTILNFLIFRKYAKG